MTQQGVVLITGASGLIGTATIAKLAKRHTIVGRDRPIQRRRPSP